MDFGEHAFCTLPYPLCSQGVAAADFKRRTGLCLKKDRGVVKGDPDPAVDSPEAAVHVEQRNVDARRCPDNDPALVKEPVVRELLLDEDERLSAMDNLVLAHQQRFVPAERKNPARHLFCRGDPGGEDLAPCLDIVALDDPPNRDVGLHEVVPELRCKKGDRGLRFRIDQHLPGCSVTKLHDPVVHGVARRNAEAFCGKSVSFYDFLFAGPDRHRVTGERLQQLRDRPVRAQKNFLHGREAADLLFYLFEAVCNIHPHNLHAGNIKDTDPAVPDGPTGTYFFRVDWRVPLRSPGGCDGCGTCALIISIASAASRPLRPITSPARITLTFAVRTKLSEKRSRPPSQKSSRPRGVQGVSDEGLLLTGQTQRSPFPRVETTTAGRVFAPRRSSKGTGAKITSPRTKRPMPG